MTEMQQLQNQMAEALGRIQHLEEEISSGKELPCWQYLIARPHRWNARPDFKQAVRFLFKKGESAYKPPRMRRRPRV